MQIQVEGHGVPGVFPEIFVTDSGLPLPANQRYMPMSPQSDDPEPKPMSEHFQCNYHVLFPKSHQLLEYVKKPTYYRLHTTVNVLNFLASFLYLTAAMGLLANAIAATTDSDLRNNTPSVVRARTFTDILGYFAAPFIITLVSAVISQIIAFKTRRDAIRFQNTVLSDYKSMKKEFLFLHKKIGTFFFICEMIEKINIQLFFEGRWQYSGRDTSVLLPCMLDIAYFERILIARLKELDAHTPYLYSPQELDLLYVREKLLDLVLNESTAGKLGLFYSIMAELRKQILTIAQETDCHLYGYDWFKKFESSLTIDNPTLPLMSTSFMSKRSKNEILLYLVGEISYERRKSAESPLLKTIDFMHVMPISVVRETLTRYWNTQKLQGSFAYPFDADLKTLARYVYVRMKTAYPNIVF